MKTSVYGWQKPTTPACKPLVSSVKHPKWHTIARWAFLELYFDQSLSCSNLTQLPTSRSSTPNQQEPPQPAARLPHPTALELVLCMFASPPPPGGRAVKTSSLLLLELRLNTNWWPTTLKSILGVIPNPIRHFGSLFTEGSQCNLNINLNFLWRYPFWRYYRPSNFLCY